MAPAVSIRSTRAGATAGWHVRLAAILSYNGMSDPALLEQIYQRNLEQYGDKFGPTVDWFRRHNKSWDQIIESATRPGG